MTTHRVNYIGPDGKRESTSYFFAGGNATPGERLKGFVEPKLLAGLDATSRAVDWMADALANGAKLWNSLNSKGQALLACSAVLLMGMGGWAAKSTIDSNNEEIKSVLSLMQSNQTPDLDEKGYTVSGYNEAKRDGGAPITIERNNSDGSIEELTIKGANYFAARRTYSDAQRKAAEANKILTGKTTPAPAP